MIGDYKAAWTAIGENAPLARRVTVGEASEQELEQSAEATLKELRDTVGILETDKVLEVGCGIGRMGRAMARSCGHWTGSDVAAPMLAIAAERLRDLSNVDLIATSGYDLDVFEDAVFDLIYCTAVFMHLEMWDRFRYIADARRVLKPNGRLYVDNIDLCSQWGWSVFASHWEHVLPSHRRVDANKPSTEAEIETYFMRAGFDRFRCRRKDGWVQGFAVK